MPDSAPPSSSPESVPPKKDRKGALNWTALGSAVASLIIGASAYMRSQNEPQAKGAYETLVTQVLKMQEDSAHTREDLNKMRTYLEEQNKDQDGKIKVLADALEAAATHPPAPAAAPATSSHPVKVAVKKAKAAATASAPPPPTLTPPPARPDRASMDKAFKNNAAQHDSSF